MSESGVADRQALDSFVGKWMARWPEWRVAEVFVPVSQRQLAVAWFALRQELTTAAWGGTDPLPGEAKLAWWVEELQGWSQGRRRHPLGIVLQRLPAPWMRLAAGIPALLASREPSIDGDQGSAALEPFAEAVAAVNSVLFNVAPTSPDSIAMALLVEQLLLRGDAAVPLQLRARLGAAVAEQAAARAWACDLLQRWPLVGAHAIPERIQLALLQARLHRFAEGAIAVEPPSRWRTVWTAWRAARG